MNVEQCEDGSYDVFVRQSWINEAVTCPNRGRFAIIDEEAALPNDATVLGTAVHGGIAADLLTIRDNRGTGLQLSDIVDVAYQTWADEAALPMRWVKYSPHQIHEYIPQLCRMYYDDLRKHVVNEVVDVEAEFKYLLDEYQIDTTTIRVWAKGTIDFIGKTSIWDWKTAGQPYKAWEKQRQAIQPSIYSGAVVANGTHKWPVQFRYGVMVRDKAAQIVPVERTPRHLDWVRMQVRPFVTMALNVGYDTPWAVNDTHFLCSEKWCSWYDQCKGQAVNANDMITIKWAA